VSYEQITLDVEGPVATLTLNRPESLNAFTVTMLKEMLDAFDRIDADDDIRAVVVTGAGRAFCAGADLAAGGQTFDSGEWGGNKADLPARDGGGLLTLRIFECLKPVIAAINGPAVGVGITMTLAMDVRMASTAAKKIGFVFAKRGLVPEAASSWFLTRAVGVSTALEWTMTGRIFDASEALERGLVRSVHEPDELLPAARALAEEMADGTAPVSAALTRRMLWRGLTFDHPMRAHRADSRGIASRGVSGDAREGITAFLEKRRAAFPEKVSTDLPDLFPDWVDPAYQ
jgi:enoyl-CoA hydratase/carnithine racemase